MLKEKDSRGEDIICANVREKEGGRRPFLELSLDDYMGHMLALVLYLRWLAVTMILEKCFLTAIYVRIWLHCKESFQEGILFLSDAVSCITGC